MCLTLNKRYKKNTAKKDIVVYKVLFKHFTYDIEIDKFDTMFETIYQHSIIKIDEIYESNFTIRNSISSGFPEVHKGLHSYKYIDDAIMEASGWMATTFIAKCIIPKGSEYYVNGKYVPYFGNPSKQYASNKLKYIKIVLDNK